MTKINPLVAAIEQLEAERALLDTTIAFLKGRLATSDGAHTQGKSQASVHAASHEELRSDAFFGMKAPAAVKTYLELVKQPKAGSEITRALLAHGFTTSSSSPANSIRTTLGRLQEAGEVVQVKKEWGLSKWYPGLRNKRPKGGQDGDEGDGESE